MVKFEGNWNPGKEIHPEQIKSKLIAKLLDEASLINEKGCASCHVLITIIKNMKLSGTDFADTLSELLLATGSLSDRFIEMMEKLHMKNRMLGFDFAIKSRAAKN